MEESKDFSGLGTSDVWCGDTDLQEEITNYLVSCHDLYLSPDAVDTLLAETAERLVQKMTVSQLAWIGDNWVDFYNDVGEMLPIRVRAGIRRGYHLLTVASMSRF